MMRAGVVKKLALHWQISIALALGVVLGLGLDAESSLGGWVVEACRFIGDLFLRALKMLIVPLIAASIISGVASLGDTRSLGRLGAKTAVYYLSTSLIAVLVGLSVVSWLQPGIVAGKPAGGGLGLPSDAGAVRDRVGDRDLSDLLNVIRSMVPENVVADAASGAMLGVITFSLLFGAYSARLPEPELGTMLGFWRGVNQVMMLITGFVMRFAPIGVFGLVTPMVAEAGLGALGALGAYVACVLLALGFHAAVVLPAILRFIGRLSPARHLRAMAPALLMAFSTASSSATLPLTLARVRESAGVSNRVSSFTLPLGATINMDGTALYECVAALFIAQAYGLELGPATQLTVVLIALLSSVGVAGIPSASLVAITLILTTVGLPAEAAGLILAVDRPLDMCRTAVNVWSDTCCAVIVARSEGERDILEPSGPEVSP